MKRIIAFVFVFLFLFSAANADSFSAFAERWNKMAHIYNVPELSENDFVFSDGYYGIMSDGWRMLVSPDASEGAIMASDPNMFLAMCVTFGTAIVEQKTTDSLFNFRANVLDRYLRLVAEKDPSSAMFENYQYTITKREDLFFFTIIKQ